MPSAIVTDTSWTKAASPYLLRYSLSVQAGATLTLEPGTVIKMYPDSGVQIFGNLVSGSTSTDPVVITSYKDDTAGGDSNEDGDASNPTRGDWRYPIRFYPESTGSFVNTIVKYGGEHQCSFGCSDTPMVLNSGGTIHISSSTFSESASAAVLQGLGELIVLASKFSDSYFGVKAEGGRVTIHDSSFVNDGIAFRSEAQVTADVTSNWWGDAGGPRSDANQAAIGSLHIGSAPYDPWLSVDPEAGAFKQSLPTCVSNCYSNVLFLPGIEGSRLYDTEHVFGSNQDKKLWEPVALFSATIPDLFLDEEGRSIRSDIYTKDIIDEAMVPIAGPNIYKSFISMMDDLVQDGVIADWEPVPYDWRLSIDDIISGGKKTEMGISYLEATSSPYLVQELKRLAESSRTGKVTIIAHSNGGLVAKALMLKLASLDSTYLVDKIIFVAVPQTGTPEAIGALLHGFNQGVAGGLVLSASKMRQLADNMPAAYGLLPSQSYFDSVTDPVIEYQSTSSLPYIHQAVTMIGPVIDSFGNLYTFLRGGEGRASPSSTNLAFPSVLNPLLLDQAANIHNRLDLWTPPQNVELFQIAGWGVDTVSGIKYYEGRKNGEPTLMYVPEFVQDGDGTVVVPSALATVTSTQNVKRYWVDLKVANQGRLKKYHHGNIFEVESMRDFLRDILKNNYQDVLRQFVTRSQPPDDPERRRLSFILHSEDLALNVSDNDGNHTGLTEEGYIQENIPGTFYREFGNVKLVSFDPDQISQGTHSISTTTPKIKIKITKKINDNVSSVIHSFTLDIKKSKGDSVSSGSFSDVTISSTTEAILDISDELIIGTSTPSDQILALDTNGNGIPDEQVTTNGIILPVQETELGTSTDDTVTSSSSQNSNEAPEGVSTSTSPTNDIATSTLENADHDESSEEISSNEEKQLLRNSAPVLLRRSGGGRGFVSQKIIQAPKNTGILVNEGAYFPSVRISTSTKSEQTSPQKEVVIKKQSNLKDGQSAAIYKGISGTTYKEKIHSIVSRVIDKLKSVFKLFRI